MAAKSSGIARLLSKHKAAFMKDVDINRVANKLARKGVISKKEEQVLYECNDAKLRAELFVDILSDKNPNVFHEFCGALEECAPFLLTRFLLDASPGKKGMFDMYYFLVSCHATCVSLYPTHWLTGYKGGNHSCRFKT